MSFLHLSSLHHGRGKVENHSIRELVTLNCVFVYLCVPCRLLLFLRGASGLCECLIFISSLI